MAKIDQDGNFVNEVPNVNENVNKVERDPNLAPDMRTIFTSFENTTNLSENGHEYIKSISNRIKEFKRFDIKTEKISHPCEVVYFTHQNSAFVLLFAESVLIADGKPVGAYIPAVIEMIQQIHDKKMSIFEVVIVTPGMYKRADAMSNVIINTFIGKFDPKLKNINISSFRSVKKWHVDVTSSSYIHYINRFSPHDVPARHDFGFLLSAESQDKNIQSPGITQRDQIDLEPVAAVTGYVEFMYVMNQNMSGDPRIMPIIHVTDIVTHMIRPDLLTVLIPIIADTFYYNKLWQAPYLNLDPTKKNYIGSLVLDNTTNKPVEIQNTTHLRTFFSKFIEPPVLCFDVTEGRVRIPGLERFAYPDNFSVASIITESLNFIGDNTPISNAPQVITRNVYREFVGNVKTNEGEVDSRWIDFLNTVHTHPQDWEYLQEFLVRTDDPTIRMRMQQKVFNNFEPLYLNHCCILSGEFVSFLLAKVKPLLFVANNINQNIGHIDTQGYYNNAISYMQNFSGGFSSASYQSGYNTNYMNYYNRM